MYDFTFSNILSVNKGYGSEAVVGNVNLRMWRAPWRRRGELLLVAITINFVNNNGCFLTSVNSGTRAHSEVNKTPEEGAGGVKMEHRRWPLSGYK